jgi:ABC-2 type transport system ATP-binding protein
MIDVEGLTKRYGDLIAVDGVSFTITRGEIVGFLGPNGAGKTTTMRMLTGFLPPSEGRVRVAGHDLHDEPIAARRAIGYLPENPPLYPEMRVSDYLRFVATLKDVPRKQSAEKLERAAEVCGLGEVMDRVIGTLSRGFRQRVSLAQAIVHEPPVLVLDEPTVGLDPVQIVEIRELIKRLAEVEGRTVILSTHIIPLVERICPRVLLIRDGRIRADAPIEEVRGTGSLEERFLREAMGNGGEPAAEGPA